MKPSVCLTSAACVLLLASAPATLAATPIGKADDALRGGNRAAGSLTTVQPVRTAPLVPTPPPTVKPAWNPPSTTTTPPVRITPTTPRLPDSNVRRGTVQRVNSPAATVRTPTPGSGAAANRLQTRLPAPRPKQVAAAQQAVQTPRGPVLAQTKPAVVTPPTLHTRGVQPAPGARVRPDGVPADWSVRQSRNQQGVLYQPPGPAGQGRSVRVMDANPSSRHRSQQKPHVAETNSGGDRLDVNGRRVQDRNGGISEGEARKYPAAHIPLTDYRGLSDANRR